MQRRELLGTLASATALGLAGCTDSGAGDGDEETDGPLGTGDENTGSPPPTDSTDTATLAEDTTTIRTDEHTRSVSPDAEGTESPSEPPMSEETGTIDGVDYSLEITSSDCGTGGYSAIVDFDSGAGKVTVTGTVDAPDPCHRATVTELDHDDSAGELAVTVGVEPGDEGVCVDCIAEIDYEARFNFPEQLPDSVTVTHDGSSGRQEVTSTDR